MTNGSLHKLATPASAALQVDPDRRPWDQLDDETGRAYAAFVVYRDMGVERSLVKACRILGKNGTTIGDWSAKYQWVPRVVAWDTHQHRLAEADKSAQRDRTLQQHQTVAGAILAQAARHLTPPDFQADGRTPLTEDEKRKWKARVEVVRMATHALKETSVVQRLGLGLPTVISKTQAETEEAVKAALEAQRVVESIVRELMDNDCACEPCRTTKERLGQLFAHQQRARELIGA